MKTFVFRSKVSTSSPISPLNFGEDNEIVIPMAVYEKLNTSDIPLERRRNASGLLNYIDSLTGGKFEKVKKLHSYTDGLVQSNGSKLFILESSSSRHNEKISTIHGLSKYDIRIFQLCLDLMELGKDVHLISKNPVIRQKAQLLGIIAEPFKDELAPSLKEQYTGKGGKILTSLTSYVALEQRENDEGISIESLIEEPSVVPVENMFYILSTPEKELSNEHTIVRYSKGRLFPLSYYRDFCPTGYKAMNDEQKMMMECLLAPASIAPLVIIKGAAGSGKTYGAIASALENIDKYNDTQRNIGHYREFLVSAPVVDMVQDQKMGYLPGDIDEKFSPYTRGFADNIKNLFSNQSPELNNIDISDMVTELFDRAYIEFEPANYLRGGSISNAFFMLDEAQNYSPYTMPHIVTRAGKNCKIVLMGDSSQVSALELNERFNGLVYASESMKGSPLTWQVALSKSVRSPLAKEAIYRMKY